MAYARERVKLTSAVVKKARALVAGEKIEGRGLDYADTVCAGLVLRAGSRSLTWLLKTRTATVRLGDAASLTVDQARDAGTRARLDLKEGKDPRQDVRVFEGAVAAGLDDEAAADAAWPEIVEEQSDADRRRRGPWQWRDLVDAFLEAKAPKLAADYRDAYASYLRDTAFERIERRDVGTLRIKDLEAVRDDIADRRTPSAAKRSVQQGREALSWAWRHHAGRSGLGETEYEWWLRWSVDYVPGVRDHVPTVEELARTLAVAERYRSLGQTEHSTGPSQLGLLWAVVLTGQRTGPLSGTETTWCLPDPEREGWTLAAWTADAMKSRYPHALPIPPAAWAVIERYHRDDASKRDHSSEWLFPAKRGDGHVSQGAINQILARLQGLRDGKPCAGRDDLLARHGIRPWIPHDARRALSTFLGDRRLGGAGAAILDHADRKAEERERTMSVTRIHYDRAQRLALKAEGMAAWCSAILDAYEREREAVEAVPAPPRRVRPVRRRKVA